MAVWAGTKITSLLGSPRTCNRRILGFALNGTSVPDSGLGPYVQEAIDQVGLFFCLHEVISSISCQINFVIGDPTDSAPGMFLRISYIATHKL